jgi:hypothetical protein
MLINDVRTVVNAAVSYTWYANEYVSNAADDSGYVRLHGSFAPDQWTDKRRPTLQIVLRSKSAPTAETKAWAVYNAFHKRTSFAIGTQKISSAFAEQSAPLYLGQDESGRFLYSVNFVLTLIARQTK